MPVVVFYGRSPKPLERIERIQAPVLAHYGEKDLDVNQNIPATEEAMKNYDKPDTYKIYPGAQHGFHTEHRIVTIPRRRRSLGQKPSNFLRNIYNSNFDVHLI